LDGFTLTALSAAERRALEGLLGRSVKNSSSIRLRQSELDAAIARAGLATDLRAALELLEGPLHDRKVQRMAHERAWIALLENTHEPCLRPIVSTASNIALLKRCSNRDVARAQTLLEQTRRVLLRLPESGIPLARLAAETLGDSHALDAGQPVAALVLRAGKTAASEELRYRDRWAQVGVSVNELAAPVLCLNLAVTDGTPVGQAMRLAHSLGEPAHLNLRALLRHPPAWEVAERSVFVCENPAIVAIAADRLGAACASLVCTDGMPAAAQRTLLKQLAARGAHLRYHGDFDWPGIHIGNFVMREFAATPWRFRAADYASAVSASNGLLLAHSARVAADWDSQLADTMAVRGSAVHEEAVAETLLSDLEMECLA
jgi:uncharacterized protein (TIGR02679 family)